MDKVKTIEDYYEQRERLKASGEYIENILYDLDMIDGKSSALLTHISLMFVVLGFLLSKDNLHYLLQWAIIAEFVVYIVLAMLLLRCIDLLGPPNKMTPVDDGETLQLFLAEAKRRRKIYVSVLRVVWILTFILIPIVVTEFIFL